jgi:CBS domain containing-hemolysin-like protein
MNNMQFITRVRTIMNNMQFITRVRTMMTHTPSTSTARMRIGRLVASLAALLAALPVHASFMQGDTLAKAANVLAIVVIILVPIIGIVVFWMVHVLPEKIAHKRQHPQQEAIQVLCLLSLMFGGLLWPIAWLWAYSKPVLYKMAYGTDKHEAHQAVPAAAGSLRNDVARVRADLEKLVSQDGAPSELSEIRDRLAALEPRLTARVEGER